jgi:3-methylcrotonyl-CoA carboxylase alpha subunit
MQTPPISDTVRIDAGFVAGDEVSAHYDPMIAKLIVQGPTRTIAIHKLYAALEKYEIAGLVTNVEFLKKVCNNPAFLAGDVETGFITKQKEDLFTNPPLAPEIYAQAAIGSFFLGGAALQDGQDASPLPQAGFISTGQSRSFNFTANNTNPATVAEEKTVQLTQLNTGLFEVTIDGTTYHAIASSWNSETRIVMSFFPHMRIETRIIDHEGNLTLFQQGEQYRLRCTTPRWVEKALGIKDTAHSVLAPMPCKILRVEAKAGDHVKKDQVLVVIESMKMETVIRSPQDGVISRVVHQQGVGYCISGILSKANIIVGPL